MIDLALESNLGQFFAQPFTLQADELLETLRHPDTVMTFSDSGAHVSQIIDSSIQTHFLAYWVRERQAFTLEQAVHMLTQVPAKFWGFAQRGLVRPGFVADVNIFDAETVAPLMPEIATDLPGAAMRLRQHA